MKTRILIVSYSHDISYLRLNLETIRAFASGFSGVTIVVPSDERSMFLGLAERFDADIKVYERPSDRGKWQLSAQCQKCWADGHCAGDDFVLHTDSDCAFTEPVTPEEYFHNGKPVMLYEPYSRLSKDVPWKSVTESVIGRPVEFEFMRRHPQVNPVGVYQEFRMAVEKTHKMEFSRFVHSRKHTYPWGFSEHNAIGAFAFYDQSWRTKYEWYNLESVPAPKEKLIQFWSHSGINVPQEISHGGRFTPDEFVSEIMSEHKRKSA